MREIRYSPAFPFHFGAYVITSGRHLEITEKACRGGARVIQYRDKLSMPGERIRTAREIRKITRKYKAIFIVNDSIDVALLTEADGTHLGQDDIPLKEARRISPPGFFLGGSTHSLEQALKAEQEGADYIGIGPVFATPTKENYIPIGIETVREIIQKVKIPVVAIGGVNPENLNLLIAAGVVNAAMVRAFQGDTAKIVRSVNSLFKKNDW